MRRWLDYARVSAILGRLAYLRHPWDSDAAMLVYTGKAIAEGARFCHDLCDNKFPTTGLWNAGCWRLLGNDWSAYVLFQTAMALATVGMLTRIAYRWAGSGTARATFLFALVYVNFWPAVFGGFQLETPQMFFASLAALFAAEGLLSDRPAAAFVVGLAAGCAAYLKPTGLAVLGAYGLAELFAAYHRSRHVGLGAAFSRFSTHIAMATLGVAIPFAGALYYVVRADILSDMPRLYRQISGYASESVWDRFTIFKLGVVATLLGVPMFLVRRRQPPNSATIGTSGSLSRYSRAGLGLGNLKSEISNFKFQTPCRTLFVFSLCWLAMEAVGVILQRRLYGYHFLVLAAPAALVFGLICRPAPRAFSLLAPLLPAIMLSLWGSGWAIFQRPAIARLPLSDFVATHTTAGDRLWMDNMPRLLLETEVRAGSRHVITFPFLNTDSAPLELGAELLDDLRQRPPKFIIIPTDVKAVLDRHCDFVVELINRPARRENYRAVWAAIERRVAADYREIAQVGDRTVYVFEKQRGAVEMTNDEARNPNQ